MKPFLKWAGSKHRIADELSEALPYGRRLIEPFAGSGSVFLTNVHKFDRVLAADINSDLIALFSFLQAEGEGFVAECEELFNESTNRERTYYRLRGEFNAEANPRRRAALFLYLNRHCFNGLCRYNRSGQFNVSFGKYAHPYFPRAEMLDFHTATRHVEFRAADFEATMDEAGLGDVVYCDPPYVALSETANFTSYAGTPFALDAHRRLSEKAREAAHRGAIVVLSNHDTEQARALYQGAHIRVLEVRRSISRNAESRRPVRELLATFDGRGSSLRAVA